MHKYRADADCCFCNISLDREEVRNAHALGFHDGYPVTEGHRLVVPMRHVRSYWDLTAEEREACHGLLVTLRERIMKDDPGVSGFNVGINDGASAGQTVFHCHFHLIPRRVGDVEQPRGGVRHVIPGRGSY